MLDRDVQYIRFIGVLTAGIGLGLFFLTAIGTLAILFGGNLINSNQLVHGGLVILLAFIMSFSLISCGSEIQRIKLSSVSIQQLRLVWTALVLIMFVCALAGLWLAQPLAFLASLMLLALFSARGAILRLMRH